MLIAAADESLVVNQANGCGTTLTAMATSCATRRRRSSRNWSALYQQRPAPETGDYFKDEWFHTYTSEPPRQTLNIYGGSDYAVTSDGGDYTVHVVIGVANSPNWLNAVNNSSAFSYQ
jgi:hypothetical protein